jgi:hypothetical protein
MKHLKILLKKYQFLEMGKAISPIIPPFSINLPFAAGPKDRMGLISDMRGVEIPGFWAKDIPVSFWR